MDLFKKTTLGANLFGEKILCPGAGGAFTPSGSPVGHWSADTITGLEDGDPVATWPDQSGNSNDLVQATPAKKPTYQTNEINTTLPIVRFDGTDDFMISADASVTQPCTIFFVWKAITWTHLDYMFDGSNNDTTVVAQFTTTPNVLMYAGGGGLQDNALALGDHGLYVCLYNGGSSTFRLNAGLVASGNVGADDPGGFTIGARALGYSPANIDVAEAIFYGGSESPTDNEAGLNTKYAIY